MYNLRGKKVQQDTKSETGTRSTSSSVKTSSSKSTSENSVNIDHINLEELEEVAGSNTIAYLSGLPVLAILLALFFMILLCNFKWVMSKLKKLNLGTNLDQIRHQVQTFFKIRTLEVPPDVERGFQRHPNMQNMQNQPGNQYIPGMYPNMQGLPPYVAQAPPVNQMAQNQQPNHGNQIQG